MKSLDVAGLSVFLAMPAHSNISPLTVASLLNTKTECFERGIPLHIEINHGTHLPHHTRTQQAWSFLKTRCNRLFWIDSDMVWEAKDFTRLLALSTVMDVVAGAYIAKQDPPIFMFGGGLPEELEANEWGCIPVGGLGLGFTCVSRIVVEFLAADAPLQKFHTAGTEPIPHIFRYGESGDGNGQGEDMAFFEDCRKHGFPVWCDPTITLGHVGTKVYRASLQKFLQPRSLNA